jgi:hypothetical protein
VIGAQDRPGGAARQPCSSSVTNPSATSASPILWIGNEGSDYVIASSLTGTRESSMGGAPDVAIS